MKKTIVYLTVKLVVEADADLDVEEMLAGDMTYSFDMIRSDAEIVDTEITEWEVTDSKCW